MPTSDSFRDSASVQDGELFPVDQLAHPSRTSAGAHTETHRFEEEDAIDWRDPAIDQPVSFRLNEAP